MVVPKILQNIKILDKGCWEWQKCLSTAGYGQIRINQKTLYTHRIMYEYYHGQICPDMEIDHLCRNRACCNPLHLEQVTRRTNQLRGFSPMAIQAQQTHCKRGHELTMKKNGHRQCYTCSNYQRRMKRRMLAN